MRWFCWWLCLNSEPLFLFSSLFAKIKKLKSNDAYKIKMKCFQVFMHSLRFALMSFPLFLLDDYWLLDLLMLICLKIHSMGGHFSDMLLFLFLFHPVLKTNTVLADWISPFFLSNSIIMHFIHISDPGETLFLRQNCSVLLIANVWFNKNLSREINNLNGLKAQTSL